jgi:hypothetical protein
MNTKEKQQQDFSENLPNILLENDSHSNSKSEAVKSCKSPFRLDGKSDFTKTHLSDNETVKTNRHDNDHQHQYVTRSGRTVKPVSRYIQESE